MDSFSNASLQTWVLLKKDLIAELRTRETILVQLGLALILTVLAAFGIKQAFLPHKTIEDLFPLLVWMIFLFSATVSIPRAFEYEQQGAALQGVLLTGVSSVALFVSKLLILLTLTLSIHLCSSIFLALMLNVSIFTNFGLFFVLSLLVVIGYGSLGVILGMISINSTLRGMLLPIILLPLLFPLLFAALELHCRIMQDATLTLNSSWGSVLIGFDIIYLVVCASLYEYVVRE